MARRVTLKRMVVKYSRSDLVDTPSQIASRMAKHRGMGECIVEAHEDGASRIQGFNVIRNGNVCEYFPIENIAFIEHDPAISGLLTREGIRTNAEKMHTKDLKERAVEVIGTLVEIADPHEFLQSGSPKTEAVEKLVGEKLGFEFVNAAYREYRRREDGKDDPDGDS